MALEDIGSIDAKSASSSDRCPMFLDFSLALGILRSCFTLLSSGLAEGLVGAGYLTVLLTLWA